MMKNKGFINIVLLLLVATVAVGSGLIINEIKKISSEPIILGAPSANLTRTLAPRYYHRRL